MTKNRAIITPKRGKSGKILKIKSRRFASQKIEKATLAMRLQRCMNKTLCNMENSIQWEHEHEVSLEREKEEIERLIVFQRIRAKHSRPHKKTLLNLIDLPLKTKGLWNLSLLISATKWIVDTGLKQKLALL